MKISVLFSFARIGVRVWNSIPMKLRIKNRTLFKRELKNRLLKVMEIEEMNVDMVTLMLEFIEIHVKHFNRFL